MAGWNEIKYITLVSPTRPLSEPDMGPAGAQSFNEVQIHINRLSSDPSGSNTNSIL